MALYWHPEKVEIAYEVQFYGFEEEGKLIGVIGLQKFNYVTLVRHAYVLPSHQGKGIGTKLLECLVNVARDSGITIFEGDVLSENKDMMSVLRSYGFHVVTELEAGVYHFTFPTTRTKRVEKREEDRERVSSIASVHSFLFPHSVAVIGAARRQDKIGHIIFKCILQSGFSGTAYPVNPKADSVLSVKAYPSILDIPGKVDLAVIAVPAELVPVIAGQCGQKGVHTLVVISDGFKETGIEGASREKR